MDDKRVILFPLIALIVGLAGGGIGGYVYGQRTVAVAVTESTATPTPTTTATASPATSDEDAALATCLKAKWGEAKYQALTANPDLASVDDKFAALPCYK